MRARIFVDASVLFAAAYSRSGSAFDLTRAAVRQEVDLWVSGYVMGEARRNLSRKSPDDLRVLDALTIAGVLPTVDAAPDHVDRVALLVERKDAPVIAAAMVAGASIVVTYDRRHLLSQAELILSAFDIEVLTPEDVLRRLAADEMAGT